VAKIKSFPSPFFLRLSQWGIYILAVILVGIWLSFPKKPGVFPLDDSYIHLVYAQNLADTGDFSLNPGEPSMGTSSPLWVVILSFFSLLRIDLYWTAQILSFLSFTVLCYLAIDTVKKTALQLNLSENEAHIGSLLAGAILVLNGNLHWFALSGMETMFFLCLCFLAIKLYSLRDFDYVTGILAGMVFLARAPGGILAVIFVLFELWRRRCSFYKGLISMGLVISPYILVSLRITGKIIPTTAKGKLLTYVNSGFNFRNIYWYLKTLFIFQKYQPQNYILLAIIVIMVVTITNKYKGRWGDLKLDVSNKYLECSVLVVWGLMHLLLYTIRFRTIHHNTRYLANEYIILTILGTLGILFFRRAKPDLKGRNFLLIVCLMFTGGTLLYWQEVYARNINHISEAYVPMAKWINQNTTLNARIASFDIGIMRYVGDRYTIDLGGLSDPEIHPYLKKKECGEFVRQRKADYIMYPRNPEIDVMTGINLAEYSGPMLLKQLPIVHFKASGYEAPAIVHTYRLDLNRIIGWFPHTPDGILQALSYDNRPYQSIGRMIDDRLEFVGYSIDQREIEAITYYTYAVNFTFFYKAHKPLKQVYWLHLGFFDPELGAILFGMDRILTKNLIEYDKWPIDRVIQDHHYYYVPSILPQKKLRIKFTINHKEFMDNPEKYTWSDLGPFENKGNELDSMDHNRLMTLSSN
jgi:branched-subunit amino acid transport protein